MSRLLAQRGCRVAVVSRSEDAAQTTVASLHGGILSHTDLHTHARGVHACSVFQNKRCRHFKRCFDFPVRLIQSNEH